MEAVSLFTATNIFLVFLLMRQTLPTRLIARHNVHCNSAVGCQRDNLGNNKLRCYHVDTLIASITWINKIKYSNLACPSDSKTLMSKLQIMMPKQVHDLNCRTYCTS